MDVAHTAFAGDFFLKPKAALRSQMLKARRAQLSTDVQLKGDQAQKRLLALPFFQSARTVALYAGLVDEVATDLLAQDVWQRLGTVCFPRVVPGSRVLDFHRVAPGDSLVEGPPPFRLREPSANAERVELDAVDVVVVPGLAFTRSGARLGYGGGYYDATLAMLRPDALAVGLCFELSVVADLPMNERDVAVAWVVSEQAATRTTAAGAPRPRAIP